MFPPKFDYYRAETVSEALELLDDHPEAKVLAGGHSLLPTMKTGLAAPEALVDISEIAEISGVDRGEESTSLGAVTNYADVADDQGLWNDVTVLAEATSRVGDIQVRNRGTVGGNIAHADPASDLPAAVLAADATITAQSPDGERTVDVDDFFVGMYETALESDELLIGIEVPHYDADDGGAYAKKASPSSGYAMVGVASMLRTDGDAVESARVAANGAMDHAVRLDGVEDELVDSGLDRESLAAAAERAAEGLDELMMMDDIQASSEFRAQLLRVYTERSLRSAAARVGERTVTPSSHEDDEFTAFVS